MSESDYPFKSLAALDREIARLEQLLPNYKYPNLTKGRIEYYRRYRTRYTWPRVWKARLFLSNIFAAIGRWVAP